MVHSILLVNTPAFVEKFYQDEILTTISQQTAKKIRITGESSASELNLTKCPIQYGGESQFNIEIEAGPWLGYEPSYDIEENKLYESDGDQLDLLGEQSSAIDLLKS